METQENPIIHDVIIQIVNLVNFFCVGTGTNETIEEKNWKLMSSMNQKDDKTKIPADASDNFSSRTLKKLN